MILYYYIYISDGVDVSDTAWKQATMSLRRGGLGLRSLVDHCSAAYIASFSTSGSVQTTPHLDKAISHYNSCVADCDTLSITSLKDVQTKRNYQILLKHYNSTHSLAQVPQQTGHSYYPSPPLMLQHAWISVVPSISLGLHLHGTTRV